MSLRWVSVCAASTAANLILTAWGRGAFGQFLFVILLVPIATAVVGVGLLKRASAVASGASGRESSLVLAVGLIAGSCVLSLPAGSLLNQFELKRARHFCDRLRPDLERFRQANGRYPERLSQVPVKGQRPRLLERIEFYHPVGEGAGYRFSVSDHSRLFAGYDFDSRRGTWDYWD